MSSLNIALFFFSNTHVLVITFCSTITLSLLLLLLFIILGESDHVSYMTDKSSCYIYKLDATLGHFYVMLTIQGFIPSSDYYPDSIIILFEYYMCRDLLVSSS